tara:strand:- start:2011 stop:3084 length:1074 start_codon:yes stop_codon:yes gene_type:complete
MLIYVFTLLVPSLFYTLNLNVENRLKTLLTFVFIIYLIVFIGLRHHTGGDWSAQVFQFYKAQMTFNVYTIDFRGDYLYNFLNYIISRFFGGIYIVNLVLASLLVFSIYLYSSLLPVRFLSLLICFPYIFTVVGMGFTRQGLALSFMLIALYFFQKNKYFVYIFYSLLSIFSHKSVIIILALNLFNFNKYIFSRIIFSIILFLIIYFFVKDDLTRLYFYYVGEGVHLNSKGSVFRNIFNSIPVLIFIILFNRFLKIMSDEEKSIYVFFSIYQIICLIFSFYVSTFADRMTIFSIPIQLFVFSNLSLLFDKKYKLIINSSILFLYNVYFLVWAFFGQYSIVWFNYRNILIEYFANFPVR